MKNNIYIVYSEKLAYPYDENPKYRGIFHPQIDQCDSVKDLLFALRAIETEGNKNIFITTIQNGKPKG